MRRAHAGQAARHDLAALGDELAEQTVVLVVDVFDSLGAGRADFITPEELASATAFAGRTSGTASAAAKSWPISTWPISTRTPFTARSLARCRLLWCFCLVCHISPLLIPIPCHSERSEESWFSPAPQEPRA